MSPRPGLIFVFTELLQPFLIRIRGGAALTPTLNFFVGALADCASTSGEPSSFAPPAPHPPRDLSTSGRPILALFKKKDLSLTGTRRRRREQRCGRWRTLASRRLSAARIQRRRRSSGRRQRWAGSVRNFKAFSRQFASKMADFQGNLNWFLTPFHPPALSFFGFIFVPFFFQLWTIHSSWLIHLVLIWFGLVGTLRGAVRNHGVLRIYFGLKEELVGISLKGAIYCEFRLKWPLFKYCFLLKKRPFQSNFAVAHSFSHSPHFLATHSRRQNL